MRDNSDNSEGLSIIRLLTLCTVFYLDNSVGDTLDNQITTNRP